MATKLPVFKPAPGSRLSKSRAQALGLTMARLRQEDRLTPDDLVTEARDPASPIHDCFEWDDSEAAEQYRLMQARHHMRSITVTVKGRDGETSQVRYAYVIERSALPYVTVRELSKDTALAQQVADQMHGDALDLLGIYEQYCRVFPAITRPFRRVASAIRSTQKKGRAA